MLRNTRYGNELAQPAINAFVSVHVDQLRMRWCAEDLGLSLRWHTVGSSVNAGGIVTFPSAPMEGNHVSDMKAIRRFSYYCWLLYLVSVRLGDMSLRSTGWRRAGSRSLRSAGRNQSSSILLVDSYLVLAIAN